MIEKGMEKLRRRTLNTYGTSSNVTFAKMNARWMATPPALSTWFCIENPSGILFCKNELVSTPPFFMTYLCFW